LQLEGWRETGIASDGSSYVKIFNISCMSVFMHGLPVNTLAFFSIAEFMKKIIHVAGK